LKKAARELLQRQLAVACTRAGTSSLQLLQAAATDHQLRCSRESEELVLVLVLPMTH
jgi:hypothetical protein